MIRLSARLSSVALCLLLAGCNSGGSTVFGTDSRSYSDGVPNSTPGEYSGRVMDGYLRNARVWLDLNGNGVYDSSPVTVTSGNETITLPHGEPTAMTGSGGAFTLDVSGLEQDPKVAPSADPRKYRLMAVAIPGVTVDESTGATVSKAYLMTAKPGVTVVSPLTTIEEAIDSYCVFGTSCGSANDTVQSFLGVPVNLEEDYIKANNARSAAYARAVAYFLQLQTPAAVNASLQGTDGISAQGFSTAEVPVINRTLVSYARTVLKDVDQAASDAGGNYALVSPENLSLPTLSLDYSDPMVVTQQKFYVLNEDNALKAKASGSGNLKNYPAGTLTWYYDTAGRPTKVESDGYMQPSLVELMRMANVKGAFGKLNSQIRDWFFTAFNPGSSIVNDGVIDERMVFDWDKNKAMFYSTYSGHGATGSVLGNTGDQPQDTYQWTYDSHGRVNSVSDNRYSLAVSYVGTSSTVAGYVLTDSSDGSTKTWQFQTANSCYDGATTERLMTSQVPLSFSVVPNSTPFQTDTSPSWDYDTRNGRDQLLRAPFFDLSIYTQTWLQWNYLYYSTPLDANQPDLIKEALLGEVSGDSACSTTVPYVDSLSSSDVYFMVVDYNYELLSKYVLEESVSGG